MLCWSLQMVCMQLLLSFVVALSSFFSLLSPLLSSEFFVFEFSSAVCTKNSVVWGYKHTSQSVEYCWIVDICILNDWSVKYVDIFITITSHTLKWIAFEKVTWALEEYFFPSTILISSVTSICWFYSHCTTMWAHRKRKDNSHKPPVKINGSDGGFDVHLFRNENSSASTKIYTNRMQVRQVK